jgi:hypothetical protein
MAKRNKFIISSSRWKLIQVRATCADLIKGISLKVADVEVVDEIFLRRRARFNTKMAIASASQERSLKFRVLIWVH